MLTKNRIIVPASITILIVSLLSLYYWDMLGVGTIHQYDEYHTLDRSNAFLITNDWFTVYDQNRPTFRKPPLQYWLTAVALKNSQDLEFALRLVPYLFGIGLLISTGILAYLINPSNPYAAPSAIIIMSSSTTFWVYALSAMLETGAAFFSIISVIGTILAIRQPKWWYFVAAAVGFGALQKAPIALLMVASIFVLMMATYKLHDFRISSIMQNNHFRLAAFLLLLLVSFWPLLQLERYGYQSIRQAYIRQMVERFNPIGASGGTVETAWYKVLIEEAFLWIPALIAVIVIPFLFRTLESFIPWLLILGFCIMMEMASGAVYDRYILLICPLLAASLGALLSKIVPGKPSALFLAFILSLPSGGPFKQAQALGLLESSQTQYRQILENFRAALRARESFITCDWGDKRSKGIYPGSLSYFASNGQPILTLKRPGDLSKKEHIKHAVAPPYRGLCTSKQYQQLKEWLIGYNIIEESNGYVHWTSNGSKTKNNF